MFCLVPMVSAVMEWTREARPRRLPSAIWDLYNLYNICDSPVFVLTIDPTLTSSIIQGALFCIFIFFTSLDNNSTVGSLQNFPWDTLTTYWKVLFFVLCFRNKLRKVLSSTLGNKWIYLQGFIVCGCGNGKE